MVSVMQIMYIILRNFVLHFDYHVLVKIILSLLLIFLPTNTTILYFHPFASQLSLNSLHSFVPFQNDTFLLVSLIYVLLLLHPSGVTFIPGLTFIDKLYM